MTPHIVMPAIRVGAVVITVASARSHKEILKYMDNSGNREHGFIDSEGRYLDRRDAAKVALMSGQAIALSHRDGLHSRDIWG